MQPAPHQDSVRVSTTCPPRDVKGMLETGVSVRCRRRPGQPEKSQPESTSHRISHNLYNPKAKNSEPRKAAQKQGRQGSGFLHFRCDPRLSRDTDPLYGTPWYWTKVLGSPD